MRKVLLACLCLLCWSGVTLGQISINAGRNNLEISGAVYSVFNLRFVPGSLNGPVYWPFTNTNNADLRSNRFEARNIQFNLEGRYANAFEYQLQFNLARLASQDVENPVIMEGSMSWVANPYIKLKTGFFKVPYSRSSLVSYTQMPYIQRADFVRGEVFSRRDVGIMAYNSFWNQRINVYAGLFSGQGEAILLGNNDRSGNLELVGRVDFAYPSRFRYREIDDNNSPVPMVAVGLNARTNTRSNPYASDSNNYGLKYLQGTRSMVGFDVAAQYKNWSAQLEYHYMHLKPDNMKDYGQGLENYTNYFQAGGFIAQLNYNWQTIRSVLSLRYDRFNSNDLVGPRSDGQDYRFLLGSITGQTYDSKAVQENLSLAYNYKMQGWNSVLRLQFIKRLKKDETLPGRQADDQLRIGWQYLFR